MPIKSVMDLTERVRRGDPDAVRKLCDHWSIPYLEQLPVPQLPEGVAEALDVGWARRNRLAPIGGDENQIVVAVTSPLVMGPADELAHRLNRRAVINVAPEEEILSALNTLFSEHMDTADDLLKEMTDADAESGHGGLEDTPDLIDSSDSAPVIRLVNRILVQAVSEKASDIHIEPGSERVDVRFRIDGILYSRLAPPMHYLPFLVSRIKVMAGLDIAERRLPQDGRFQFSVAGKSIDVRVSVIPTAGGERLVLRLLNKSTAVLGLEELGLKAAHLDNFVRLIDSPHGILLVTGPTGSGKTTTLYAALSRLNTRKLNIITIEDPVEYQLPGVGQIQVNTKVGLDFARGLRSVLRHDPDVIMIGEIRDLETAEIAIQASLTGHLVFSTLHTNDAPSAITRLADMGVEPYLVSSAVIGVLAQRLVRRLCPVCRKPHEPSPAVLARAGLPSDALDGVSIYQPQGCDECYQTGYRGRSGIFELLLPTPEVQRVLSQTSEAGEIRKVAIKEGMTPLMTSGLKLVREGVTSLEEILRVTMI